MKPRTTPTTRTQYGAVILALAAQATALLVSSRRVHPEIATPSGRCIPSGTCQACGEAEGDKLARSLFSSALICCLASCLVAANGCSSTQGEKAASCGFTYNQDVMKATVIPAFNRIYGGVFDGLDLENPVITDNREKIEIMIGFSDHDLLDPPYFIITVDRCTRHLIEMHSTSPVDILGAPKKI